MSLFIKAFAEPNAGKAAYNKAYKNDIGSGMSEAQAKSFAENRQREAKAEREVSRRNKQKKTNGKAIGNQNTTNR